MSGVILSKVKERSDSFLRRCKEIHNDKYDYSLVDYTYSYNKITIICPHHGEYNQRAQNHLAGRGCHSCAGSDGVSGKTTKEFISEVESKFGNKYLLDRVEYTKANEYVEVGCRLHGYYEIRASHLLKGVDCLKCSWIKHPGGLNDTTIKRNEKEFRKEENNLYVVNLPDLGTSVYKIGISKSPDVRFSSLKKCFGTIEPHLIVEGNTYDIYHLEQRLHKLFEKYRYDFELHKNKPTGWTEVFNLGSGDLQLIIDNILSL